MTILQTAAFIAAPEFTVPHAKASAQLILGTFIGLALMWVSLKSLLGPGRQGDYSTTIKIAAAAIIALVPAALGLSYAVALGYGQGILSFVSGLL